jgi:hypothetical protein
MEEGNRSVEDAGHSAHRLPRADDPGLPDWQVLRDAPTQIGVTLQIHSMTGAFTINIVKWFSPTRYTWEVIELAGDGEIRNEWANESGWYEDPVDAYDAAIVVIQARLDEIAGEQLE